MHAAAKQQYEGGYYLIQQDMIRAGIHSHTLALDKPISGETINALNAVQKTPWRINGWLLNVMVQAYESGLKVGDLPYFDAIPVPRKTDEEWEAMDDEQKADWKRELSDIHGENARMEGRRHSFIHKLDIARELSKRPAIWFPHFLDFRGRFYPMTQDLHPQSDDIGRALLEFAEGKRLGERGLFWLAIRLANTFGEDKMSLADRALWVEAHAYDIFDSATNPLDGKRFWADADEPWSFLATAKEWADAHLFGQNGDFVSHLSVQLDGSCNGLQHLSAMGRDPVGARATNVAANTERQDIYTQVAEIVKRLVSEDATAGVEEAHQWVGRIDRKTVKRAVMTTPYGVTPRGISDQLVKDGFAKGMKAKGQAANYLRDKIVVALDQTVVSAKSIMGWVQDLATTLSKHGKPFVFETPTGNLIQQSYYQLNQVRVQTLLGTLAIWKEDALGGLNDRKQALASAPNLIHAFDASHLARTVNAIEEKRGDSRISYSMIHDSYGTHASDVDLMRDTLRREFVCIYRENWLEKVETFVRSRYPDIDIPSYTDYVRLGDFDVAEVLGSEFFFS
jgi:DNA-directed RNA polymerase